MSGDQPSVALYQQVLVELAHWIGRTMQYSAGHPSCTSFGAKVHATLTRALELEPQLEFGILKDNVMIGDVPASHPAVRARIAAHLHDRGVLVLRFFRGVALDELQAFIELLLQSPQAVFDRGGLRKLLHDHGLTRVQIEELAHDISEEQLESGRRRRRLREFFADALRHLLARRASDEALAERILEMLAHPELAVTILEDHGAGLAEAAAGMALMVQQEEHRSGAVLVPQLRAIFAALAPMARDRLLLGFPPLVGEFRAALAWAMRGYREDELARFIFPALRARAHELDLVLYALSVLVSHDGTRLSTLRRVGLMLHDLPLDDAVADEVLTAIARPVEDFESYKRERLCLVEPAGRALGARALAALTFGAESISQAEQALPDHGGAIRAIVKTAAGTKQFERFCSRLPDAAAALGADGQGAGLMELVRALGEVQRPEWRELAARTAEAVAVGQAELLLLELERLAELLPAAELALAVNAVRAIVVHAPRPVLERLDTCEHADLRKLLIDLLPLAGPRLVPLLRTKLTADAPLTVIELLALLPRLEGRAEDLVEVAYHRDERVRLEVVRVLRGLPADERAMEIVVRYLVDPSRQVRLTVRLLVRGESLGPTAIAGVARILADASQPDEVHRQLILALGQARHDAAALLLFELMQPQGLLDTGPATAFRDLAATALRRCPAPGAPRLFQDGLESTSRRVRKACERAARPTS